MKTKIRKKEAILEIMPIFVKDTHAINV